MFPGCNIKVKKKTRRGNGGFYKPKPTAYEKVFINYGTSPLKIIEW
jgi:hypothetical protein